MYTFRKAKMVDAESIHQLINNYAEQGLMLARSRSMIYESIREFTVVDDGGKFLGVGGLHVIWEDLAEIRALALDPSCLGKGIGRKLIEALVQEAQALGVARVFALTYQKEFFDHCGFKVVRKEEMSPKVWKECINCPKFPNCDEVAMIRNIN
ncbi:MAG TPA: N-acetyltransferase [Bacillota bacterium]|jgi:amino-acid N-acetyltransferase|nr:N-acetyltransferase [Bacillota bacterium]